MLACLVISISPLTPPCSSTNDIALTLDNCSLVQHANFSTHCCGHTFDLVCTSGINIVSDFGSQTGISDNKLITVRFDFLLPKPFHEPLLIITMLKLTS